MNGKFRQWLSPIVYLSNNWISLIGVVVVTAATVVWLLLLPVTLRGGIVVRRARPGEELVTLEGGMDDPDGLGEPSSRARSRSEDDEGWDLDAPVTRGDDADADSTV